MALLSSLAAAALLAAPAPAQDSEPMSMGDDCAFLVRAFEETYRGLRREEGKLENADHDKIMMHLQIQANTVQLADAAGCDVRPMVSIARQQLQRYNGEEKARMRKSRQ